MLRFCLSLIFLMISSNVWSASIQGMRLSQEGSDTRLVIDLDKAFKYQVFSLANPARLVVDIHNTQQTRPLKIPELSSSPIRAIRHGSRGKDTLRLVLDLQHSVAYESRTLAAQENYPHRLVLDLHDSAPTKTASSANSTPRLTEKPATIIAPKAQATAITKAPPVQVPVSTTNIKMPPPIATVTKSKKSMPRRDIVIAIDPGHGGQDSGALGKNGTKEKDIVLSIAKRLAKIVNSEPGMRAYLTRDTDIFIPLRHRIVKARQNKADMFISIHADAFKDTKAKGASVFVLSQRGASSEAAQMLANKENAADLAGGISLDDKDNMLASVLLDLSQDASLAASLEVADTVLSGLKRVGNVHKKHVESAAFVVLKSPDIPSILVETAFVSNPDEERKLNSPAHQNKIARAILSGISNYFQRNPLPGTGAPQQHIVSSGDTLSTIAQRYQVSMIDIKTSNKLTRSDIHVGEVLLIP
ncbi:MAG TPA: AMIN domain-containing protein [Methylophaga sp.]|nr:AMIN domain-containing protein [Methylophaga sp.]